VPGARWFPGAQVDFARQVFRHAAAAQAAGRTGIVFQSERMAAPDRLSWPELLQQVRILASRLGGMGVTPGDRVCVCLPNTPHTVVALLACASVGAVWSVCAPASGRWPCSTAFGRSSQRKFAVDGQVHGGARHDRCGVLAEVLAALPSVAPVVLAADLDAGAEVPPFAAPGRQAQGFAALTLGEHGPPPTWLPFYRRQSVVNSACTTGLPTAQVHGHGGVVLGQLKGGALHYDIGSSVDTDDSFPCCSSTGWVVWNAHIGALLGAATT
jgi:acetoacetyl-CoA synthetase